MAQENTMPRPPYDAEIQSLLPPTFPAALFPSTLADIPQQRHLMDAMTAPARDAILADPALTHTERTIPGPRGPTTLSILEPAAPANTTSSPSDQPLLRPCILHIHGGGMTSGTRFAALDLVAPWIKLGAVAVAVEYHMAPEHPHPAPIEDCYAALAWVHAWAESLGIDTARVLFEGQSAGGGIAAATALMARDRGGPPVCAQLLGVPMLDWRNGSVSARQFWAGGTWCGEASGFAWGALLGGERAKEGEGDREGKEVSYYASPALAEDLKGLPTTYIDVSSTEPFRDEAVAYASRLWECGVQAELHVWPGGPHGFDMIAPTAAVSKMSIETRSAWVKRTLLLK
ncbi:Carboxylesterase NlhH [Lasiodiplodia theobromae]|uniref:Carboxylesterase NlhH n=1 Tax=Lasiodiplodia theobromae TaxID=45133 RepID=A0A5N5D7B9_9PEZI|nr:Carboxylesterase NlhH [Lasiodiplodia theobromae]